MEELWALASSSDILGSTYDLTYELTGGIAHILPLILRSDTHRVKEKADKEDDENSLLYVPQVARVAIVVRMYGSDACDIPN